MLPEEQVRRICTKDITDISLSDLLDALHPERSYPRKASLRFGGFIEQVRDERSDKTYIVVFNATGNEIVQAEGTRLLSTTIIQNTPESITFSIDETRQELELSIYEASCAIVLY